ncbi:MAG TPA: glycosyltransferase [Oscillatoriaceae cyanobacterium]
MALVSVHGDPLLPLGAEEAGGQNVYVREVALALAERGHHVDVFTRGRDCATPEVLPLGNARVVRLPAGPRGFISRNQLFRFLPEFTDELRHFAAGRRYDVLHTNYWLSGWVGRRLAEGWETPQAHTHHSLGAVKYAAAGKIPTVGRQRLEVESHLIAGTTVVATSPQDIACMERYYQRRPRSVIVPCGVNASRFVPQDQAACRATLGLPQDVPLVAYVGRFDPQKGIDTLVRAAKLASEKHPVHLVLAGGFEPGAGDSNEYERIRALVEELGLGDRTTFLGRQEQARLPLVYGAADLCVVPSHYESFGLVAIEAMGCGTPVVASEVGGLRYTVIHRETGLLVPPRNDEAFAGAITLLLDDPALRARMGAAGARLVQRVFTWDAVAERLEGLYQSLESTSARAVV